MGNSAKIVCFHLNFIFSLKFYVGLSRISYLKRNSNQVRRRNNLAIMRKSFKKIITNGFGKRKFQNNVLFYKFRWCNLKHTENKDNDMRFPRMWSRWKQESNYIRKKISFKLMILLVYMLFCVLEYTSTFLSWKQLFD